MPGICGEVQTGGGPPGLSETDALPDIREQTGLAGGMLEILYAVYHFCFMIPCSVVVCWSLYGVAAKYIRKRPGFGNEPGPLFCCGRRLAGRLCGSQQRFVSAVALQAKSL